MAMLLHGRRIENQATTTRKWSWELYRTKAKRRMAVLLGAQDAVLTMSGSHAVRGLLETICGTRTPIYADARSWAAGAMRQDANVQPFAHNDVDDL